MDSYTIRGLIHIKNYYELIESESIRNHCEKINYELDAVECAYLVWDNNDIPIEEKHKLYEEIMNEREDVNIIEFDDSKISFFEALKKHIKLEKQTIEIFKKDADQKLYERFDRIGKLKTLRKTFWGYVTNIKENVQAYYNYGKMVSVETDSWVCTHFMTCEVLLLPLPFKSGDIVHCSDMITNYSPCIFDCICNDYDDDEGENSTHAYVYIINSVGDVDRVLAKCSKMDLYDKELPQDKKIYQALSDCIKGNITPATLMNAQYVSIMTNKKCDFRFPSMFEGNEENNYIENLFCTEEKNTI